MDEVSEFYNEQVFKSVHKLTKLNCQAHSGSNKDLGRIMEDSQDGEA